MLYGAALVPVSLLPSLLGLAGRLYFGGALALGAGLPRLRPGLRPPALDTGSAPPDARLAALPAGGAGGVAARPSGDSRPSCTRCAEARPRDRREKRWLRPLLWGLLLPLSSGSRGGRGLPAAAAGGWAARAASGRRRCRCWAGSPLSRSTNRDGRTIRLADLAGAPWIADFVFTRCVSSCPLLTARLARLDRALPPGPGIRLVSFSVDPAHDTPPVLERYARSFGRQPPLAVPDRRRGRRSGELSRRGFKLALEPGGGGGAERDPAQHPLRPGRRAKARSAAPTRRWTRRRCAGSPADARALAGAAGPPAAMGEGGVESRACSRPRPAGGQRHAQRPVRPAAGDRLRADPQPAPEGAPQRDGGGAGLLDAVPDLVPDLSLAGRLSTLPRHRGRRASSTSRS